MRMKKAAFMVTAGAMLAIAAGCSAEADEESGAPDLTPDVVGLQQVVDGGGGWSENALTPTLTLQNRVKASATFTGPAGGLRKMGVCLLRLTDTPCSGADAVDPATGYGGPCAALPLVAGGYRYCTAPDGAGQKYCALRDGSQSALCAGTPAYADKHAIAPGTYSTTATPAENLTGYISYACFEQCVATDPSSSSLAYNTWDCPVSPAFCYRYYPGDAYCGGSCPSGGAI